MGIKLISNIEQANGQDFYLVDSNDVRGGIYYCDTFEDKKLIPSDRLRNGMLCYIVEEDKYYKFKDNEWTEFRSGSGGDGGGGAPSVILTSETNSEIALEIGEKCVIKYSFTSPNIGKGTVRIAVNDEEVYTESVEQGENTLILSDSFFVKGKNKLIMYVADRMGVFSNSLIFTVNFGALEITSSFDSATYYDEGSSIRYYFTPTSNTATDTLTFYMEIDGVQQQGISCTSGVRGTYTFPREVGVGVHKCRAYIKNQNNKQSNILAFNLIILNSEALLVSSTISEITKEEGYQVSLDYQVSSRTETKFNTIFYVDNVEKNRGTCSLAKSYWNISTLGTGVHKLKLLILTLDGLGSAQIEWDVTIVASQYTSETPIKVGCTGAFTARDLSNISNTRDVWIGYDEFNSPITANLYNYAFNSTSGWVDDSLLSTGNNYTIIPLQPLKNNARSGVTIDIEFTSKAIGNEKAEVMSIWNTTDNCGIKVTYDKAIIKSKSGNKIELNFTDNENTAIAFVIDRDNKMAKVYLNGIITEAFYLSDYITEGGIKIFEDFSSDSNIILGGGEENGWCRIKNLRIYETSLSSDEIITNFISNERDKGKQKALRIFQSGETLPTMYIEGDFYGIGKSDAKSCKIRYLSTNEGQYGASFELNNCTIQYQGTSSLGYAIKNYKIKLKDDQGNKYKYNPYPIGVAESTFCLKAD